VHLHGAWCLARSDGAVHNACGGRSATERNRVAAGAAIVQVASTRTAGGRTELHGISALDGLVRARRIVVPTRGFAGATVEGLVVAGRAIQVHPNTLVSLGSLGYLMGLEEAVAEGAGGVIGIHVHLLAPMAGLAAGSDLDIGLPVSSAASVRQAHATPSAGGLPGLAPLGRTLGDQAVSIARSYVGTPYVWGGGSPTAGFDCSGFTQYVYARLGVALVHYAASQWHQGRRMTERQVRPGDLVFFEPKFDGPGHVGIYVGHGLFIDAPHTGDVIRISSFADPKWAARYMGAVRPY
jgi:cell wall-associated NlpC family hydrolase